MSTFTWAALGAAAWACAPRGGPDASSPRDQSTLTQEEVQSVSAPTLFEVIRIRRPRWLSRARPTSFRAEQQNDVVVYVDNVRFGGPETLRQITPGAVVMVQYFTPSQAEARFGQGHMNGVILVTTAP